MGLAGARRSRPGAICALAARLGQVPPQPAVHNDALVDAKELALLGVLVSHVRGLARRGVIPSTKVGSRYVRFNYRAVQAALEGK